MDPSQARNPLGKIVELAKAWPSLTSIILGLITACGYPPLHAWWIAFPALALLSFTGTLHPIGKPLYGGVTFLDGRI